MTPNLIIEWSDSVVDNWASTERSLSDLFKMDDNWDGEGADAPKFEIIKTAYQLLISMQNQNQPSPTQISATLTGGIVVYWRLDDVHIEAEINEPNIVEWMQTEPNEQPKYWDSIFNNSFDDISPSSQSYLHQVA